MTLPEKMYCPANQIRPGDRLRRPCLGGGNAAGYEYLTVKEVWYAYGNEDMLNVSYVEAAHFSCLSIDHPVVINRRSEV